MNQEPEQERDYREGVDALQADMANHQRRFAGEVTASANQSLAATTMEQLEKLHAEQQAAPRLAPVAAPVPEAFATDKTVEDRKYLLDKAPDKTPMFRTASEFEHQVLRHAMPRIKKLMGEMDTGILGTPSWRSRAMAAMYFKVKSMEARAAGQFGLADNYERAYQVDLQELLDASCAKFGDWRKGEADKIIVSG